MKKYISDNLYINQPILFLRGKDLNNEEPLKIDKEPDNNFNSHIEIITKKFNDKLRDFQPIAFLGSLSLIIATFSGNKFGSAQDYATVAGFCFLLAFLTSLLITILNLSWYPSLSILPVLFNSFGVIFLFLVSWEFAKASVLLKSVIEIIEVLPLVIVAMFVFTKLNFYSRYKRSSIRSVKVLNIVLLLIYILSCIILLIFASTKIYSLFWHVEINYPFLKNGYFGVTFLALFVLMIDKYYLKYIIGFDEKKGIYKYYLYINDAINYNTSLGIIFVSFSVIFLNEYDFSFFGKLGLFMILVINFILIIIKIKILPSVYKKTI